MENKKLIKQEAKALKETKKGKRYSIGDFSFTMKKAPKYRNYFNEVLVSFFYNDEKMLFHYFIDKDLKKEEAFKLARQKINALIKSGEIRHYAKKYYHRVY